MVDQALVHEQRAGRISLIPAAYQRIGADTGMPGVVVRLGALHPTLPHSPLMGDGSGVETPADDSLIAKHRRFDQASCFVARTTLPTDASALFDRCNMSVTLCCSGFTCNRRRPWWNDDRGFGMTPGDSLEDGFAIIRAVRHHGRNISIDLIRQVRYFGNITDIFRRHFHRDDFMHLGIHAEMQLALTLARPDTVFLIKPVPLAANREAGAIDQEMQWLRALDPLW